MQLFQDVCLSVCLSLSALKKKRDENKNDGPIYMRKIWKKKQSHFFAVISYKWNVM
jgi:hypothetical protein